MEDSFLEDLDIFLAIYIMTSAKQIKRDKIKHDVFDFF